MSPAGRPREFDEDDVLDRVVRQFWQHGYEATSLTDLVIATGVQKGSLYKAFGDKHALFMMALDRYVTNAERETRNRLQHGPSAIRSLRDWAGRAGRAPAPGQPALRVLRRERRRRDGAA